MSNRQVLPPARLPTRAFEHRFVNQNGIVTEFWMKQLGTMLAPARVPQFLMGTHTQRLTLTAASYPSGTHFQESDRLVTYVSNGQVWVYESGVMQTTQANLPTDLGTNDIGFLVEVNDYAHLLQWTGASWAWGPGDTGSDYYVTYRSGVTPGTGWRAANGATNVPRLKSDGTLGFATVANVAGNWYRQ